MGLAWLLLKMFNLKRAMNFKGNGKNYERKRPGDFYVDYVLRWQDCEDTELNKIHH